MNKDSVRPPEEHRDAQDPVASMLEEARSRLEDQQREARSRLEEWELAVREHEETVRGVVAKGWTVNDVAAGTDRRGRASSKLVATVDTGEATVRYDLTVGPTEWKHLVSGPGVYYVMYRSTPAGVIMSPEKACELYREVWKQEWEWECWEQEHLLYLEMRAERGPDEEPPTVEEVRAEVERSREEWREKERRRIERGAYFEVKYDAGASS